MKRPVRSTPLILNGIKLPLDSIPSLIGEGGELIHLDDELIENPLVARLTKEDTNA